MKNYEFTNPHELPHVYRKEQAHYERNNSYISDIPNNAMKELGIK